MVIELPRAEPSCQGGERASPVRVGVEQLPLEGQVVQVTGIARTVADCVRFCSQTGLDVAMEALADALRIRRLNLDELHRLAMHLRVRTVMRPYVERLAAS